MAISKLNGCIVWNVRHTVFGWKRSAICAQAVYILHSTMPSVTCLRLIGVSVICRVTYFQFPIRSAFLWCRLARQHSSVLVYPILDIGRCRKFGSVSCTERISQGKNFQLILMVPGWLYSDEWTQYSIRPKSSAVCNRSFLGPPESLAQTVSTTSEVIAGLTRWQTDRQTTLLGRSQ